MEDQGTTLISWNKVCIPKDQGGLGVINTATHNKCLLMKHLHKFLNRHDLPWVYFIWESYYPQGVLTQRPQGYFWWKNILKLLPQYKKVATGSFGLGNTITLWDDNWGVGILKDKFPQLFSFSSKHNLTIQDYLQADNALDNFHIPLSTEAHQQFLQLQKMLQTAGSGHQHDKWSFPWGFDYSSIKM